MTNKTIIFGTAITVALVAGALTTGSFAFALEDVSSFEKGNDLFELGRYQEAITWYDKALEIDPRHVNALYGKGAALSNLDRHEEAITWYDKALEVNPKDPYSLENKVLAFYEKGRLLLELEQPEEALVWYDKALEIDPNAVYVLSGKGWALSELGNLEEALVWFDKALEIDPNAVYVLSNKGVTLYRLGQNDEAISYFDKALAIDPNYELAIKNKELALGDTKSGTQSAEDTESVETVFDYLFYVIIGIMVLGGYLLKRIKRKKYKEEFYDVPGVKHETFSITHTSKEDLVLRVIKNGVKTFDNLSKETLIEGKELNQILSNLEENNEIRIEKKSTIFGSKIEIYPK